jgi:DNA gyrase subunit A
VTENGYGKRTAFSDYRVQARGGIGIKTVRVTDKTGPLVTAREVVDQDELMAITATGMTIRIGVAGLRLLGRDTQGVRLIRLGAGDRVVDVAPLVGEDAAPAGTDLDGNGAGPASAVVDGSGNGAGQPLGESELFQGDDEDEDESEDEGEDDG